MTAARAAAAPASRQTLVWEQLDPTLVRVLSANGRSQSHWPKTNARNRVMASVYGLARSAGWAPFTVPVVVTFRWIVPTRRRMDVDNLASSGIVKATLDSLVRGGWLVDDSSAYVTAVHTEMAYEKGRRALIVTLEPAT